MIVPLALLQLVSARTFSFPVVKVTFFTVLKAKQKNFLTKVQAIVYNFKTYLFT